MSKPHRPLKSLGHEGADAFAKVRHHLDALTARIGEAGADTASVSAVALGHAAVDLVGAIQARLDDLESRTRLAVRRHPVETLVASCAAAALAAAAVASLATYAATRRSA